MFSKMIRTSMWAAIAILALGSLATAQSVDVTGIDLPFAKTLNITVNGTLGPILSGPDPLGANGKSGKLTVKASEALSPKKHTKTSATYTLPAGAMTISFGNQQFKTKTPSTMTITLTSKADILTLSANGPQGIQVVGTSYLQAGSWTNSVLKHPGLFTPSPQNLTPAQKSNGPGSKLKYSVIGTVTVLGVTGTASCSESADAQQFDEAAN